MDVVDRAGAALAPISSTAVTPIEVRAIIVLR
jgi:hypothetical protein